MMRTHARGPVVRLLTAVLTTALSLAGLVALSTAVAPSAHAAAGQVKGTVTAADTGAPLVGMTVVAFCDDGSGWAKCKEATSTTGGAYTLDLPAGSYRIGAFSADNQYAATYFGGADRASAADVVPPASGINLAMAHNLSVSGRAGQGLFNAGVADVDVCLYAKSGSTWECVGRTTTATNGTYTLWAKPGTYRVGFSTPDDHLREVFYKNAATVAAATDVVLTNAAATNISVKVVTNGKITGTVRAEGTNAAIAGAKVGIYELVGSTWTRTRTTTANASGAYEVFLDDGTYRLEFGNACPAQGPCPNVYQSEFWNDKGSVATATGVTIANGATVANISPLLTPNGQITGTVTAEDGGAAIAGAEVAALRQVTTEGRTSWQEVATTAADHNGGYRLYVPAGTYRLSFDDPACTGGGACADAYQTEFWNEAATVDAATSQTVAGSAVYSERNGTLAKNGHITGTVTAQSGGAPLAGVEVVALDQATYQSGGQTRTEWVPVSRTTTAANGTYSLPAGTGTHRVRFAQVCAPSACRYLTEFYDDATAVDQATDVTVTGAAATTPGIDAALSAGARLSGTLTDQAGGAVAQAKVTAYALRAGTWTAVETARSDADGRYALLLPDGSYRLGFSSDTGAFTQEYFDNSLRLANAATIVVAGADKPGLDAVLGLALDNVTAPAITGTAKVGETLTASNGTWSATPDGYTYAWRQAGTADPIGTDKDLVVPAGAVGKAITVEVTAKKAGYADAAATSAPTAAVALGTLTATAKPAVSGAATVGSTVQALEGTWSATPDAFTYQWFQSGTTAPIGSGKELVVPAGALGKTLRVEVTATKAGYTDGVVTSDPSATVAAGGLSSTAKPTVTGDAKVGSTLTAGDGTWSPAPDSFGYRWFQAGKAEPIGTAKQLEVPAGALGKTITVEVTAKKAGYGDSSATSDPTAAVVAGALTSTAKPTIGGDVKVGATVQAVEGTWSQTPGSYTYKWFQAGKAEPIGTEKSLVVPAAAVGKKLTVEVTARKVGYTAGVATSDPSADVAPGTLAVTAKPAVTGTVQVGETVTATTGTWSPVADSYTYRWFRSGSTDPIGTGKELVVPAAAAGEKLTVEVTATAAGYADGTATSDPSGDVAPGELTVATAPSITGTAQVGATLTATPGTWSPVADSYAYRWFRSGSTDPIGTGKELVVPAAAAGEKITVEVTATAAGYADGTARSDATATVTLGALANGAKPTITGAITVGGTVEPTEGTWTPTPDAYTYKWLLSGATDPISTDRVLVIPDGAAGKTLRVEVTAKKAGYTATSATSSAYSVTAPAAKPPVASVKPRIVGKVQVGRTITVDPGTWSPTPTTFGYRWYANNVELKNVTGNRLTITPALANKVIRVLVGAAASGAVGFDWTNQTAPVALGKLTVGGRPTITGTPKVGKKIKVVVRAATPAGAKVTVQWLVNGKVIPGATAKKLKLGSKLYRGTKVRARVTYTLKGYTTVVLTTAKVRIR